MTKTQQENKKLVEEFPFLLPRYRNTGEILKDYDYSYTELDSMPEVWRKSFGLKLCRELKLALGDNISSYRIVDIKEKYGMLCWYDIGNTEEGYKVINKYENLSTEICFMCGKPATQETEGWIYYLCDDCYRKRRLK